MTRYIILLLGLIILSCRPSFENTENQKLYDQVMEVHDEVMPEMGTIHKLRKKLKAVYKKQIDDQSKVEEQLIIKDAITNLETADDAMMDWMAEFDPPKEDETAIKNYLFNEMIKVKEVKTQMLSSIKTAQQLVK